MAWEPKPHDPYGKQHKQLRTWAQKNLPQHCTNCGETDTLELDHIRNLKQGGTHTTNNVQWLCTNCHKTKTQHEAAQARKPYRRPHRPSIGQVEQNRTEHQTPAAFEQTTQGDNPSNICSEPDGIGVL